MILLDEHLLSLRLDRPIAAWYPGHVCYVTDLRPETVIKDEVISTLLQQVKQPTFVTGDVAGFWHKVTAHKRFCVVCVTSHRNDGGLSPSCSDAFSKRKGFAPKGRGWARWR